MTSPDRRARSAVPLFVGSEALSMLGNSAIVVVLPWLVLSRTGDPSVAGLVAGVAAVPAVASALVGGYLIDRVGQRRMSVLADLGSAISVAALAVVDLWTGLTVGWFVALGVLGALFDVPGMTARETMMGRVAETGGIGLERLAGLRQTVFGVSFLAGPAIAGSLLTMLEPISVVWLTAGCSLLAALGTACIPLVAAAEEPVGLPAVGGFATVRHSPALRSLTVLGFGAALVTAPLVAVLLPSHFIALGEPRWFGYATSGLALGSLMGAVVFALGGASSRRVAYVGGLALTTVGLAGCLSLHGLWVVAVGMWLVGLGSGLLSPVLVVFFTEQVRESVRGRVLGLFNALTTAAAPLALGGVALLLGAVSIETVALVVFGVWLLVAAYSLSGPTLRTLTGSTPSGPTVAREPVVADH